MLKPSVEDVIRTTLIKNGRVVAVDVLPEHEKQIYSSMALNMHMLMRHEAYADETVKMGPGMTELMSKIDNIDSWVAEMKMSAMTDTLIKGEVEAIENVFNSLYKVVE